mmetsp:Transcript_8581/g.24543  ORF Transcript_8581/g.24543 Transcript_8581/m.24543 type:complete len:258 (+) Transcript_8581:736-1509(+)
MLRPLLHLHALPGVPDPESLVRGSRAQVVPIAGPVQIKHRVLVALEHREVPAIVLGAPKEDLLVHGTGGEARPVRGKLHGEYLRGVALAQHDRSREAGEAPNPVGVDSHHRHRRGLVLLRQSLLPLHDNKLRAGADLCRGVPHGLLRGRARRYLFLLARFLRLLLPPPLQGRIRLPLRRGRFILATLGFLDRPRRGWLRLRLRIRHRTPRRLLLPLDQGLLEPLHQRSFQAFRVQPPPLQLLAKVHDSQLLHLLHRQ